MRHRSLLSIIEKVFVTSAGLVALALGGSSLSIALLMSGGTLLSALVGVTRLRTLVGKLPRVQWRRMGELARTGTPYLMMAIFAVIYYRINAVMLSLLVSEQVVGWFGAAFRFFDILMFLPSILSMAVFPVLARTAGQKGVVTQTTVKSLEFIILSAIPLAVGTLSFSDDIIGLLFGARAFAGSAAVLRTLAPGLILVYVDFVLVTALIAMDRQKQWSYVACAAIPASIALNALLITYFQRHTGNGGIGSAIATNITEFGILLSALWLLPRGFFPRERTWHVVKTLFAGGAMFGAIKLFRMIGVPWPVQALAGAMAYAVSILSTRVFHNDELAFVRAFITPSGLRRLFASEKAGPS